MIPDPFYSALTVLLWPREECSLQLSLVQQREERRHYVMPVSIVVGGQYGSEGKGKVVHHFAKEFKVKAAVKVSGTNSGHTFIDEDGKAHIHRVLPSASTLPGVHSIIPAGAVFDPGAELNALFGDGTPDGRGGFFWSLKDSKRLRFHVSAEDISIEQALQRIRQTSSVTEEFRNNAKKLMGPLFNAPDDAVVKITSLPLWFVKEIRSELETESHSSVSLT